MSAKDKTIVYPGDRELEIRINIMDNKLTRIEANLNTVVKTLDKIDNISTDVKVLEQKVEIMDKELIESFDRINDKINKSTKDRDWIIKIMVSSVLVGILSLVVKPFSN